MDLNDLIGTAIAENEVIRCRESSGRVVDFAHPDALGPRWWVRMYEGTETGYITTRTAVEQTAGLCNPDVKLVHESESLFGDHDDNPEREVPI